MSQAEEEMNRGFTPIGKVGKGSEAGFRTQSVFLPENPWFDSLSYSVNRDTSKLDVMTLFEAQPYDPARARRRRSRIIVIAVVVLVLGLLAWHFRYWREERQVDRFFDALQEQKFEQAYGVWMNDPDWKQHPDKYSRYHVFRFHEGLGPGRGVGHHQEP